jgi:hypothetical protein
MNIWVQAAVLMVLHGLFSVYEVYAADLPCTETVPVGDNPELPVNSQTNANHGQSRTVVLFDLINTIQCCGVIVSWEVQVYTGPDGCNPSCKMDFMVFDNLDLTTREARLTGVNGDITITKPAGSVFTTVPIPVDKQIPVKAGDYLGWSGFVSGIEYFDDATPGQSNCNANGYQCNQNYLSTNANNIIQSKNPGQMYTFQEIGAIDNKNVYRYYAFRANVEKGALPTFTNLPGKVSIPSTTAVGTSVYKIAATDANKLNILTMGLIRQCPTANYFAIDNKTGEVTVAKSLASAPYLTHTLTVDVTDGCSTTTDTLDITVIDPLNPTTTPKGSVIIPNTGTNTDGSSSSGGLLSTTDGKILVGLLAAALGIAIASLVGICCLCYQLRSFMGGSAGGRNNYNSYQDQPYQNQPYRNQQNQPYQPQQKQSFDNAQPRPQQYSQPKKTNNALDLHEPRPPSFRPDELRVSNNRIRPDDTPRNGNPTPRDIHLRTASPNQYYRDQLFW